MKISEAIGELSRVLICHGDIEVQLQSEPQSPDESVMNCEDFFIVPEKYEDGMYCNIRAWPY